MDDPKRCPDCGSLLQLYAVGAPGPGAELLLGADIILYILVVLLPILLWALGVGGPPLAIAGALISLLAVALKPHPKVPSAATAQSDRYYCEACQGYFEGTNLRRLTEAEAKRAI
jgi:hypothetical protein